MSVVRPPQKSSCCHSEWPLRPIQRRPFSMRDNSLRVGRRSHGCCLHVPSVQRGLDRTLVQAAVMTVRVDNVLAVVTLLAMQAACAGVRTVVDEVDEPVVPQAQSIATSDVDSSEPARLSRVRAEQTIVVRDLLDVAVFEAPDLSRVVRVSDDGMISLPLLGPIQAAGRTPRELEAALQDTLRR